MTTDNMKKDVLRRLYTLLMQKHFLLVVVLSLFFNNIFGQNQIRESDPYRDSLNYTHNSFKRVA